MAKSEKRTRPALPTGLYALRLPSPSDPASGMTGLGHSVTIPRASHSERLAGGTRSRVPPPFNMPASLSLPLLRVPF